MRRRAGDVAIDGHLVPYDGQPRKSRHEICDGPPRQGTTTFHACATACIVMYGRRDTLAWSWVRRHETTVKALARLLDRIAVVGLTIRYLLLDRAFFRVPVVEFLESRELPCLMPVMFRGRKPKKRCPLTGLHWIKRQGNR
jgi:putative transposase